MVARNSLIAALLVAVSSTCWCGADGPPRPPKPAVEAPVEPATEAAALEATALPVTDTPDEDGE